MRTKMQFLYHMQDFFVIASKRLYVLISWIKQTIKVEFQFVFKTFFLIN